MAFGYPLQAAKLLEQLKREGDPKARAMLKLKKAQEQILAQQINQRHQQQQQLLLQQGNGMLGNMDVVQWNNMIMRQVREGIYTVV